MAIDDGGPSCKDRTELEGQVARWVSWYNTTRLHCSIGNLPPVEFEDRSRHAVTTASTPEVA